ncbi:hypothetical protein CMU93_03090 [Elizabethkingia anophelis]|nr:hypothetical protein [Elizabethkingia anophelis]
MHKNINGLQYIVLLNVQEIFSLESEEKYILIIYFLSQKDPIYNELGIKLLEEILLGNNKYSFSNFYLLCIHILFHSSEIDLSLLLEIIDINNEPLFPICSEDILIFRVFIIESLFASGRKKYKIDSLALKYLNKIKELQSCKLNEVLKLNNKTLCQSKIDLIKSDKFLLDILYFLFCNKNSVEINDYMYIYNLIHSHSNNKKVASVNIMTITKLIKIDIFMSYCLTQY